jgi:hypothetical protein
VLRVASTQTTSGIESYHDRDRDRRHAWVMHEIQTEAMMDETRGVAEPAMRTAGNRKLCSYKQLSKETMLVLKQQGCMNALNDGKLTRVATNSIERALLELGRRPPPQPPPP